MVHRVYRCVVFLSKKYLTSPNCAVELLEAVQTPDKLIICYLEDLGPEVEKYFEELGKDTKMRICRGMDQVIPIIHHEIQFCPDPAGAYQWWRDQNIVISGAPEDIVVGMPVPLYSFHPKLIDRRNDLYVGPLYLGGDCRSSGKYFSPPVLLIMTLFGMVLVGADMLVTGSNRLTWVYAIFGVLAAFTLVPFFEFKKLIDTRRLYLHPGMKPILSSHSFSDQRIKVFVCGDPKHPVVSTLRTFMLAIGNGVTEDVDAQNDVAFKIPPGGVKVVVLDSIEARNKLFESSPQAGVDELENSILVWSAKDLPFTEDAVGRTLMQYLVLVEKWEGKGLAKSVMSAISTKVVSLMHAGKASFGKPKE